MGACLLLGEKLHWLQIAGIALALLSVALLNATDASLLTASTWSGVAISGWMPYTLAALGAYGVTAILQKLSTNQVMGIGCALAAGVVLSREQTETD